MWRNLWAEDLQVPQSSLGASRSYLGEREGFWADAEQKLHASRGYLRGGGTANSCKEEKYETKKSVRQYEKKLPPPFSNAWNFWVSFRSIFLCSFWDIPYIGWRFCWDLATLHSCPETYNYRYGCTHILIAGFSKQTGYNKFVRPNLLWSICFEKPAISVHP